MTIEEQFAETRCAVGLWWTSARHFFKSPIDYQGSVIETESTRRNRARRGVDFAERCYQENSNPLYVWRAISEARAANIPLPEWAMDHLAKNARALAALCDTPREKRPARIAEALELRHPGAGRRQDAFDEIVDARDIVMAMEFWRAKAQHTHETAREIVAAHCAVSESAVDRAWRRWRRVVVPRHIR